MRKVMNGPGKRAVGTRDRVMSHLATVGEVTNRAGMASAALAHAVRYPGSSVAFAQLLAAMERSGLITREIRGKRTYRIAAASPSRPGRATAVGARDGRDLDYDELARRLLAQVLRGAAIAAAVPSPAVAADGDPDALAVVRLERQLADVRAGYRRLTAENNRLREQIRQARRSLSDAQEPAGGVRPDDPDGAGPDGAGPDGTAANSLSRLRDMGDSARRRERADP